MLFFTDGVIGIRSPPFVLRRERTKIRVRAPVLEPHSVESGYKEEASGGYNGIREQGSGGVGCHSSWFDSHAIARPLTRIGLK